MKKALVINEIGFDPKGCNFCNIFKKHNWYKVFLSQKNLEEKTLTNAINKVSDQGFVFQDEKVLPHNLYVENMLSGYGFHGVLRFTEGQKAKYQAYFGPVIEITPEKRSCCKPSLGCKDFSFNLKGCKLTGCKNALSCRSKGGQKQYVNFLNNDKNQKEVQVLNDHFGLRKIFSRKDDYVYNSISQESLSEIVKEYYDKIVAQYKQDVDKYYQQGLGYIKTIDIPSSDDSFSQAMLFGSTSKRKALMADLSEFSSNLTLSRFDVWYFPIVKGLIRRILEFFHLAKSETVIGSSLLEDNNLEIVERTYENDFNEQEETEIINKVVEEAVIGKIPVTIATRRKMGFWRRLFEVEYDFRTYLIDAIE